MKALSRIDSVMWAIYGPKLDELRMDAATHSERINAALMFAEKNGSLPSLDAIKPPSLERFDAARLANTFYSQKTEKTAIINISDVLYFSGGYIDDILAFYFGGTSTKKLMGDVAQIKQDSSITNVALNINSGGGEAFGINELSDQIAELNKIKPVTAFISGYGASASYFIPARGAGRIVTDKMALLGSIGVVAGWADYKDFYAKLGIIYEEVTSSNAPFKRLDPRNEEHRAIFKAELDGMEKVFIDQVSKGRNVSVEKVRSDFGRGAVMAGWQAVKAGMADDTGSLEQVIKELAKQSRKQASVSVAINSGVTKMSLSEKVKAFFASEEITPLLNGDKEYALIETPKASAKTEVSAEVTAATARAEKAEAGLAELQGKQKVEAESATKTAAETFAAAEIAAGRMYPSENTNGEFVSLYVQAAADDQLNPLADGSRLDNLKTIQSKRKPHGFTSEMLDPSAGTQIIAGNETEDAKMAREAKAQAERD